MTKKRQGLSPIATLMSPDRYKLDQDDTEQPGPLTLPIQNILPDPKQPRHLMPTDLKIAISQGSISLLEAVREWMQRPEFSQGGDLKKLRDLAGSIENNGLINPISVRKPHADEAVPGIEYRLITGERRLLAHCLLVIEGRQIHEGDSISSPSRIKATITAPGVSIRAHQIIENIQREDINAIDRAWGMWALRYELSGIPLPDHPEKDMASDLVAWRRVEEMLGISKQYRGFTVSVLSLCPEAQTVVTEHNLAERTIRPIVQKLKNDPRLQMKALAQLLEWLKENEADDEEGKRNIALSVEELVDRIIAGDSRIRRHVSSAPVVRLGRQVRSTLDLINRLAKQDKEELAQVLSREEFVEVSVDLRNLAQQIFALLGEAEHD